MITEAGGPRILVADDDESILVVFKGIARKKGYEMFTFSDSQMAAEFLESNEVDVCILDINMPAMGGIELLREIKKRDRHVEVIIMSGMASVDDAVRAMKEGAYDLIQKPFLNLELIESIIDRAYEKRRLVLEVKRLRTLSGRDEGFYGIIGRSTEIRKVFEIIETVALSDSNLLITGESGTGKELAAKTIHRLGGRSKGPFVAINCAAITEGLLESELFGHIKGAFTHAYENKKGLLEHANGGTVFLDEVGDIPLHIQAKLLRAIQEREIRKVGSTESIRLDVRIISATNRDLNDLIREERFREDLYYRLNVIEIKMPPLRVRKGDILLLAAHFLKRFNTDLKKHITGFESEAIAVLESYNWPGNIRELENAIERAVVMCRGEEIGVSDLPAHILPPTTYDGLPDSTTTGTYKELRQRVIKGFERSYFSKLLEKTGGNISQAAKIAGLDRSNLRKLIIKYPDIYGRLK